MTTQCYAFLHKIEYWKTISVAVIMIGIISRANRTLFQKLAPMGKYKTGLVRPNITIDITGRDAKNIQFANLQELGVLRAIIHRD